MQITKKGRENTFSQHYAYRFVGEVQVLSDHYSPKAGIIILLPTRPTVFQMSCIIPLEVMGSDPSVCHLLQWWSCSGGETEEGCVRLMMLLITLIIQCLFYKETERIYNLRVN